MMKKTFLASLLSLSIFFVLGTALVLAVQHPITGSNPPPIPGSNPPPITSSNPIKIENPFKAGVGNSLFALLQTIINDILMPIGGVLAVLAFIYSGFLYVTAQGNETKIKTAHTALLYAAIGTAVLLGSWVLATVICNTIGQLGGPVCPTR